MLEAKDLKKIRQAVKSEIKTESKVLNDLLETKLESQTRQIRDDFGYELKMEALRIRDDIKSELRLIKADLAKANRNIETVIEFFDKEVGDLRSRVERIEEILNLKPLTGKD